MGKEFSVKKMTNVKSGAMQSFGHLLRLKITTVINPHSDVGSLYILSASHTQNTNNMPYIMQLQVGTYVAVPGNIISPALFNYPFTLFTDKEARHEEVPGSISFFWHIYFLDVSAGRCIFGRCHFPNGSCRNTGNSSPSRIHPVCPLFLGQTSKS